MKKLIYRIVISSVLITILTIIYLSTIGVKTEKFNNQIILKVKEINSNFDLKLNQVSVKLNPINLTIDLKTLGTDFSFKNKIKGKIGTFSFMNGKVIQELDIYKTQDKKFIKF